MLVSKKHREIIIGERNIRTRVSLPFLGFDGFDVKLESFNGMTFFHYQFNAYQSYEEQIQGKKKDH